MLQSELNGKTGSGQAEALFIFVSKIKSKTDGT